MTRLTRSVVIVALLELLAVAVGAPLARWPAISQGLSGEDGLGRLETIRLAITCASPVVLMLAWRMFERRLASPSSSLSPAQRGYAEAGLIVVAFFLIAYQGWFASRLGLGHEAPASRELMLRAGAIFAGMVMAVQGNFSAKAPAPEGARDSATWTRARLRSGWLMTLAGLLIAVCAIALPLPALLPVYLGLGLATALSVAVLGKQLR